MTGIYGWYDACYIRHKSNILLFSFPWALRQNVWVWFFIISFPPAETVRIFEGPTVLKLLTNQCPVIGIIMQMIHNMCHNCPQMFRLKDIACNTTLFSSHTKALLSLPAVFLPPLQNRSDCRKMELKYTNCFSKLKYMSNELASPSNKAEV